MSDLTDYFANQLTNHAFNQAPMASYTTLYVGLSTAAILADGTGVAEPASNYARQSTLTSAWALTGAFIDNNADISWPIAAGPWGTITHAFIADALSGGNILVARPISSRIVTTNDRVEYLAGNLRFTLDRIVIV